MIWLELVVAAFGGGIIATIVESWFAHLRVYETARLQVLDDLDSINAFSLAVTGMAVGITQEELDRLHYPIGPRLEYRSRLATRLTRRDPQLLADLSALFTSVAGTPYAAPLSAELLARLPGLHQRLEETTLGRVSGAAVYGPRYLTSGSELVRRSLTTAAHTAGQGG
jgi:hypothetical protein